MLRIVPVPETGYKAIWDTVTDSFWQDANGQQGWDSVDDIDFGNLNDLDRLEFAERIGLLWDNA